MAWISSVFPHSSRTRLKSLNKYSDLIRRRAGKRFRLTFLIKGQWGCVTYCLLITVSFVCCSTDLKESRTMPMWPKPITSCNIKPETFEPKFTCRSFSEGHSFTDFFHKNMWLHGGFIDVFIRQLPLTVPINIWHFLSFNTKKMCDTHLNITPFFICFIHFILIVTKEASTNLLIFISLHCTFLCIARTITIFYSIFNVLLLRNFHRK